MTTRGPFTPVVRRMMPSGSVNGGVPAAGVAHPFSHFPDGGPLVAGGRAGIAGGVGEALGDPDGTGVTGEIWDDVEAASGAGSLPSHATSEGASRQTNTEMRNLRKRSTPTVRERLEDTYRPVP
ncbi:MAG: hypothetical protein ACXWDU_03890 [Actinomycetota bacterium]